MIVPSLTRRDWRRRHGASVVFSALSCPARGNDVSGFYRAKGGVEAEREERQRQRDEDRDQNMRNFEGSGMKCFLFHGRTC